MRFTQAWHSFFDRSTPNVVLRLIVMLAGVAITSASVALTRATGLGTSPVSCFPATLSYLTPLTIGTWTFIMNVVFVLIQIALLRRDFNPVQLLQIPYVFVFSALIDAFVPLCELIPMGNYALQITWSVVGCFMTAFGVFLQVKASFLTLPGEGINLAISRVTKIAFPQGKSCFRLHQCGSGCRGFASMLRRFVRRSRRHHPGSVGGGQHRGIVQQAAASV